MALLVKFTAFPQKICCQMFDRYRVELQIFRAKLLQLRAVFLWLMLDFHCFSSLISSAE